MALYESDYTKFQREMLAKHPEWAEDRVVGRALLWDRKVDLEEQTKNRESRELNRAYPYDVNFN
ncbi:MAG: DUF3460 family protein [Deltaproteobacteria bacterium]|nr:DUF3460 family protein [Deltaproteobacteria bacterium]